MRVFRCEIQVRGYELDGYGHVNHAVYLNYAEFARWAMIEEAGGGSSYFNKLGVAPVVARVEADYKQPCFLAEHLVVETVLESAKKRVAMFRQKIFKKETKVLAAELLVTAVVVDRNGKAVSLPGNFEDLFGGQSGVGHGE